MRNNTYARTAAIVADLTRPDAENDGRTLNYSRVLQAMNGMDAATVERMRGEVTSLIEAGLTCEAAERARVFLFPKFRSLQACREAYEAAMAEGRAA